MTSSILILLPPSETKSEGGSRSFSTPSSGDAALDEVRAQTLADLILLSSGDRDEAARALKIPATKVDAELEHNRSRASAPLKPAVERYTGVLFDALDAASLDAGARAWLHQHVRIHSALYGFVAAEDPIAAYRCSHDARLPGMTLKRRWREVLSANLATHPGPILDLRSRGYVELGPVPAGQARWWGDVRELLADGTTRSLNHFNKRAKGLMVRKLAQLGASGVEISSMNDLREALSSMAEIDEVASAQLAITMLPGAAA